MEVTIKATGVLLNYLPGGTMVLYLEEPLAVKEIVRQKLGLNPAVVAAVIVNGKRQENDYVPKDREEIFLIPPVSGG
ncbi:MAG: MoaD/ThiS family protein [Syntrophomonadaceae bacterium]|jgi:molybdopterin converting factor small subunit|nr:MoaD/ThiS family protein [Syntrophomonadaceae bacterium]